MITLKIFTCWLTLAAVFATFATEASAQRTPKFRRLAPGVETTVPAEILPEDTVSLHTLPFLSANSEEWTPKFDSKTRTLHAMATEAEFRHDVWCLEFTFKPLRMITVDVPQPSGRMQKKLLWYMVYRVSNKGTNLKPVQKEDDTYATEPGPAGLYPFVPLFVLRSYEQSANGKGKSKSYTSREIPAAMRPIELREDRNRHLLGLAEMAKAKIALSDERIDRSVWGVAVWEDIDPNLDFFSINIGGLTNAYRWTDPKNAHNAGDPPGKGREFTYKTLQLNFWRPGDDIRENEKEIRLGVPPGMSRLYGSQEGVAHHWTYQ